MTDLNDLMQNKTSVIKLIQTESVDLFPFNICFCLIRLKMVAAQMTETFQHSNVSFNFGWFYSSLSHLCLLRHHLINFYAFCCLL